MSPQDPSIVNTTFSLYTRSNKHKAHLIDDEDEEKLYDSNFEISKRTIIISHGWTGTEEIHSQFCPFVHKQLLPKKKKKNATSSRVKNRSLAIKENNKSC